MGKRGKPWKHWAEVARLQAWLHEVQRRSTKTFGELDTLFAWREGAYENRKEAPGERPKIFERIAREGWSPQGLDQRWRSLRELLDAVDEHPDFRGTKQCYVAEIWDRLQETSITPQKLEERIDKLLAKNQLVRLPMTKAFIQHGKLWSEHMVPTILDHCLRISLSTMDPWSRIELVWCLYIEAEPVQNHAIRAMLAAVAEERFDRFFRWIFPSDHLANYCRALEAMEKVRVDYSQRPPHGLIESLGQCPILPANMVNTMTWEETEQIVFEVEHRLMRRIFNHSYGDSV